MRKMRAARPLGRLVGLALVLSVAAPVVASGQESDAERVEGIKQTLLSRIEREPVEFRGDKPGQVRLRWEWWDQVVRKYRYEKQALMRELAAGEKYQLRTRWLFKDMKVTYGDLFGLGAEHDDKLVPLVAHFWVVDTTPTSSYEGLTLLGKKGEVKGPFVRKYKQKALYGGYSTYLEYEDKKGKKKRAQGFTFDAFTVRWSDIKDRVLDDMSEAKALEDLKLERDAEQPDQQ